MKEENIRVNYKTIDIVEQRGLLETTRNLGRLLGKTDIEGQISEIKLVNNFLDIQIKDAEEEKNKNEKMYRTLGIVAGMTITILLI